MLDHGRVIEHGRHGQIGGGGDYGSVILRQAILNANDSGEADMIRFDPALVGGTILTIDNAGGALTIDGEVDGDGTPDITVDGAGNSRVFEIASGAEATLRGLVITGGSSGSGRGGGIVELIALLADNGGPTPTAALLEGGANRLCRSGARLVRRAAARGRAPAAGGGPFGGHRP